MTFKNYIFKNLWLQVVLSLIIGLAVGLILGDDAGIGLDDDTLDTLTSYLKIPANIFLSIIQMIIVPLIFASIVVAITNLGAKDKLKTLGLGVGVYFVINKTNSKLLAVFIA
jgi:Na+/H+-dicarboxylate symporter